MWRSPLTFRLRRHPNMSVLRSTDWIFEWLVAIFLLRYSVLNCCTSVTHTYFETFKRKALPFFQSPAAHLHTPVIFIQSHDIYICFFLSFCQVNASITDRLYDWYLIWALPHKVISLTTWWQYVASRHTPIAFRPRAIWAFTPLTTGGTDAVHSQAIVFHMPKFKKSKTTWLMSAALCVNMDCKLLLNRG